MYTHTNINIKIYIYIYKCVYNYIHIEREIQISYYSMFILRYSISYQRDLVHLADGDQARHREVEDRAALRDLYNINNASTNNIHTFVDIYIYIYICI